MPFFRCGGATLSTLAKENVLNNFRIAIGNNVNFVSSFYFEQLENAYGWSDSTCTRVTLQSRGNMDSLIEFFKRYGYTAGYDINTSDENLPRWVLQSTTGDPDQIGYPGNVDGSRNIRLFYASFEKSNDYLDSLSKFDRKQIDYLLNVVGINTDFTCQFWASQTTDVPGKRSATFVSRPSWLDPLLAEAGYKNITGIQNMAATTQNQGSVRMTTASLS